MSAVVRTSLLAFVVATSGCGSLPEDTAPDAAQPDARVDAPPVAMTTYRGTLAAAPLARFGGTIYCNYTMTLSQIELEISIDTTGQVRDGTSLALAVERQLASTTPACAAGPGIPANIHRYSFRSATAVGTGYTVLMDGAPTNNPRSQLTLSLTPTAGAFAAVATWTRTDQIAVLTWTVMGNLTLAVKP